MRNIKRTAPARAAQKQDNPILPQNNDAANDVKQQQFIKKGDYRLKAIPLMQRISVLRYQLIIKFSSGWVTFNEDAKFMPLLC